jgi:hypothetical protein
MRKWRVSVLMAGLALLGCGPEQSVDEAKRDQIIERYEKAFAACQPLIGIYKGTVTSAKSLPIGVTIEVWRSTEERVDKTSGEKFLVPVIIGKVAMYHGTDETDHLLGWNISSATCSGERFSMRLGNQPSPGMDDGRQPNPNPIRISEASPTTTFSGEFSDTQIKGIIPISWVQNFIEATRVVP